MSIFNNYFGNAEKKVVSERFDDSPPVSWPTDIPENEKVYKHVDSSITVKLEGNPEFAKDLETTFALYDFSENNNRLIDTAAVYLKVWLKRNKFLTYGDLLYAFLCAEDEDADHPEIVERFRYLMGDKSEWRQYILDSDKCNNEEIRHALSMNEETKEYLKYLIEKHNALEDALSEQDLE